MTSVPRARITPPASLHALLAGAIDYAGLFPPARFDMRAAVERYACFRVSDERWALGAFVLPASRLDELAAALGAEKRDDELWPLSVLLSDDVAADGRRIAAFTEAQDSTANIESVEARIGARVGDERSRLDEIAHVAARSPTLFIELPTTGDLDDLVAAVRAVGACAKIRTGGVTPELFPPAPAIGRFVRTCARHRVAFKATAGLHHPIRGQYPLTYEPDAPSAAMFGFLNVLLAAVVAHAGGSEEDVNAILEVERAADFVFGDDAVRWHEHTISTEQIVHARTTFVRSFGSCSFEEPMEDLRSLALL